MHLEFFATTMHFIFQAIGSKAYLQSVYIFCLKRIEKEKESFSKGLKRPLLLEQCSCIKAATFKFIF